MSPFGTWMTNARQGSTTWGMISGGTAVARRAAAYLWPMVICGRPHPSHLNPPISTAFSGGLAIMLRMSGARSPPLLPGLVQGLGIGLVLGCELRHFLAKHRDELWRDRLVIFQRQPGQSALLVHPCACLFGKSPLVLVIVHRAPAHACEWPDSCPTAGQHTPQVTVTPHLSFHGSLFRLVGRRMALATIVRKGAK